VKKLIVLACAALLAASPTVFAMQPKASDPCFKRAFDKTGSGGRWLVKECTFDSVLYYQVEFRDAKLQQFSVTLSDADSESIVETNFLVVSPDTLSIDLEAERGGRVFLLHPIEGSKELSALKVPYMNPDEGGKFDLKKSGNVIRLKTTDDDITVAVDMDGRLSKVNKPARKK
jgi:hypothetical protein